MVYPMKLTPVFKDYLWGGTNLKKIFSGMSGMDRIAESWVLSAHPEGVTVIGNGAYAGMGLGDFVKKNGPEILGSDAASGELPLICKWIDAADNLSVQVHPDNGYALAYEGQTGKIEAWYVVDCEPGAEMYFGFNRKLSREEFEKRAKDGTIVEDLNRVSARPGEVCFIDSGVVHGIGKGMTVVEIGSNCNVTYRIYDYLRKDDRGNPRQLHIKKAADVIRLDVREEVLFENNGVFDCRDFRMQKIELDGIMELNAGSESFHSLICVEGSFSLLSDGMESAAVKGASFFLPAGMGTYLLRGNAVLIKTTV